jgi:hypothetical protein
LLFVLYTTYYFNKQIKTKKNKMAIKRLISVLVVAMTCSFAALAQPRTFTGQVLDANGEPLIGATLVVKGTTTGFITDLNGNFEIKGVEFPATFLVSFIGYKTTEITLTGNEPSPYKIVLSSDVTIIDDVVVVGYGTMKKRDLIGAVDAVGSEVIGDRANPNLVRSLQGQVAGLNISFTDGKASHKGSYNVRVLVQSVQVDLHSSSSTVSRVASIS